MMSVRSTLALSAFFLAISGWLGALWEWLDHGTGAGVEPGFMTALMAGGTFTIVAGQMFVMPDQSRIYALGWVDRGRHCSCMEDEPQDAPQDAEPERVRHLAAI
jgi:hypothetical protein